MNPFIVVIILLQMGATVWEWWHGRGCGGLLWFGCVCSNIAVLFGMNK